MRKDKFYYNRQGFTLMEVLMTLVVFAIGLLAIYTLSISNLRATRENFRKTLAANLAREAVELVRNRRDSNWLYIQANADCDGAGGSDTCTWDYGLTNQYVTVDINQNTPTVLSCSGANCFNLVATDLYLHNSGHYYTHDASDATAINLKRVVELRAICKDPTQDLNDVNGTEVYINGIDCQTATSGEEKVGIRVTVHMQWLSTSGIQSLDMVETLYNWR